jgi:hypothetical protein
MALNLRAMKLLCYEMFLPFSYQNLSSLDVPNVLDELPIIASVQEGLSKPISEHS